MGGLIKIEGLPGKTEIKFNEKAAVGLSVPSMKISPLASRYDAAARMANPVLGNPETPGMILLSGGLDGLKFFKGLAEDPQTFQNLSPEARAVLAGGLQVWSRSASFGLSQYDVHRLPTGEVWPGFHERQASQFKQAVLRGDGNVDLVFASGEATFGLTMTEADAEAWGLLKNGVPVEEADMSKVSFFIKPKGVDGQTYFVHGTSEPAPVQGALTVYSGVCTMDLVHLPSGETIPVERGVARFVDMDTVKQQVLDVDKMDPAQPGWEQAGRDLPVIVDTSIPGLKSPFLRVVDHHGAFLKKPNGKLQKANATMQMVNNFEAALRQSGADIHNPTDDQVDAAIRLMNIKQISTDNLADGAWSVWMAKHQAEVLKNPELRKMIRQATYFEDFTAFGNNYDRNDPAVQLQAALFAEYGRILKANDCSMFDRFPANKAEKVMGEALAAIDKMLADPAARKAAADGFWQRIDANRGKAETAVIYEAKANGKTVIKFYDVDQLSELTVFERWLLIPDLNRGLEPDEKTPIMPTVEGVNGGTGRTKTIVSIQNGLRLGKKEGLLAVLDALNQAEKAKSETLGVPANIWFGKDNVVLPNPGGGGTVLSPKEISDIVTDPKFGLFNN